MDSTNITFFYWNIPKFGCEISSPIAIEWNVVNLDILDFFFLKSMFKKNLYFDKLFIDEISSSCYMECFSLSSLTELLEFFVSIVV